MKKIDALTVPELKALAKKEGITGYSRMRRAELINLIETVLERTETKGATPHRSREAEAKVGTDPTKKAKASGKKAKPSKKKTKKTSTPVAKTASEDAGTTEPAKSEAPTADAEAKQVDSEEPRPHPFENGKPLLAPLDTGEVPDHYADRFLYGMARTPTSILFVWSMDELELASLEDRHTQLRISDTTRGSDVVRHETIEPRAGRWYVHHLDSDREYFVELGTVDDDGFHVVLVGGSAVVPPDRQSRIADPVYVRLDFDRVHRIEGDLRAIHKMRSFMTDRTSGLSELEHAAATQGATEIPTALPPHHASDPGEFQSWNSSQGGRPTSPGF